MIVIAWKGVMCEMGRVGIDGLSLTFLYVSAMWLSSSYLIDCISYQSLVLKLVL